MDFSWKSLVETLAEWETVEMVAEIVALADFDSDSDIDADFITVTVIEGEETTLNATVKETEGDSLDPLVRLVV